MSKPKSFFLHNLMKPFKFGSRKDGENEGDLEKIAAQERKQFAFQTLVSATKDFHPSHKLGEGGFGPVYKGKLSDGREIAVKRLSLSSRQGNTEFTTEAKLLARVQHRNVVSLLGYCVHDMEKLLVYEYVAHESLDKLLFKSNSKTHLDWKQRFDIIMGIARGLQYLHEDSHNVIIHRDIKASNILLDDRWIPKIADFGMARLFPEDQTHVNTRVVGTNGYMAPEYVMHGRLSVKADVYSFGVLVLELISGQKNSTFANADYNLLEWAYKLYKDGKSMDLMDPTLVTSAAAELVKTCIHVGLLCTQGEPNTRPTMRQVVLWLSKKPGHLEEPTRPVMPGSRYRRSRRPHTGMSSTAGTSGHFGSRGSDSSPSSSTSTTSASAYSVSRPDPHGKRPMSS
ncbi:Cysteine-rich receptor-like protein kinase 43 [Linum perenne]